MASSGRNLTRESKNGSHGNSREGPRMENLAAWGSVEKRRYSGGCLHGLAEGRCRTQGVGRPDTGSVEGHRLSGVLQTYVLRQGRPDHRPDVNEIRADSDDRLRSAEDSKQRGLSVLGALDVGAVG